MYRLFHDIYLCLCEGDRRVFRDFGLSNSQYRVLELLCENDGQKLTELSDKMLVARSTITRIIDQVEGAGLVERTPDPEDRRAQRAILTTAGEDLFQRARQAHSDSLEGRFAALDSAEQMQLTTLLDKLGDNLRAALIAQEQAWNSNEGGADHSIAED